MELAEIVNSEKVDKKKVEKEIKNNKYKEDMLILNSKEKVREENDS